MTMELVKTARLLMALSAIELMLAPVILIMGAFSPSSVFLCIALGIMGGLGLYAGMRGSGVQ